ncbi:MAG: metal-dependent hydrolase [Chloroflexi bacterium]|nr:metal-dependent hydrolase [Chloroflexota bacterium]
MNGRNHALLGGVATFSYLLFSGQDPYHVGLIPFGLGMVIGIASALLPDIDTPNNHLRSSLGVGSRQTHQAFRARRRRGLLIWLVDVVRWLVARLLDGVVWLLPHRGITHWLITAIILTVVLSVICRSQGWWDLVWQTFGVGYLSHLLADVCTEAGVRLLVPVYNRPISVPFLRVRTGTWSEQAFVYFLIFLWLVWLSSRYLNLG